MKLPLLAVFSIVLLAAGDAPQHHTFTSGDHIINMDVRFSEPYTGRRLVFYDEADPLKEICLIGNGEAGACPNRFVGIVATVTFHVQRATGKLRGKTSIREHVTVIAQSPDLPPRLPFDKTQVLAHGAINDLQAFGYDESDIAEGGREAERLESKKRLWRLCRQELYLNGETAPFAIIKWRYTLDAIEILSVGAGGR
jgi:hypothetical protein